jgi:hypothetical protein
VLNDELFDCGTNPDDVHCQRLRRVQPRGRKMKGIAPPPREPAAAAAAESRAKSYLCYKRQNHQNPKMHCQLKISHDHPLNKHNASETTSKDNPTDPHMGKRHRQEEKQKKLLPT